MLNELSAHLTFLGTVVAEAAAESSAPGPGHSAAKQRLEDVLRAARLGTSPVPPIGTPGRAPVPPIVGGSPRGGNNQLWEVTIAAPPHASAPVAGWLKSPRLGKPGALCAPGVPGSPMNLTPVGSPRIPPGGSPRCLLDADSDRGGGSKQRVSLPRPKRTRLSISGSAASRGMLEVVDELLHAGIDQGTDDTDDWDEGWQGALRWCLRRSWFESSIALIIMMNALCMGLQADWKTRNAGKDNFTLAVIDGIFTLVFTLEITLRLFAEGCTFIGRYNPNLFWNVFDASIVILCIVDMLISAMSDDAAGIVDVSVLRLFRVLRLARILRVVRVMRFFRDLRVMITGIMSSMKSLTWALALLLLWMFLFSVVILDSVSLVRENRDLSNIDLRGYENLPASMYTLYMCVFGGIDWKEVSDPLWEVSPLLLLSFLLYISFAFLCVLNIVTGVFVENANKITVKAEGETFLEELEARKSWLQEVQQLFSKALESDEDDTGSNAGTVNLKKFEKLVSDLRVQAIFRKLGIEVEKNHAKGLFTLLDFDNNGEVDMEEFAQGLDQLHGSAKSIDLVRMKHNISKIECKLDDILKVTQFTAMCRVPHAHAAVSNGVAPPVQPPPPGNVLQ